MTTDLNTLWTLLEVYGIATEEEIDLVTSINGYTEETLNDILYVRTGYRDITQFEVAEC